MNEVNLMADSKLHVLTLEERLQAIIASHRAMIKISVYSALASLIATGLLGTQLLLSHPKVTYFATTADGRFLTLAPLSVPLEQATTVANFVGRAITNTFTFDYVNAPSQLAQSAHYYTPQAFVDVKQQLNRDIGKHMVINQWIVNATLLASPELLQEGIVPNTKVYGWHYRLPLLLTFQNSEQTSSDKYVAEVTVIRVDPTNNPRGIAIQTLQVKRV